LVDEPVRAGNLITDSLKQLGFAERLHKQSAVTSWPQIAGELIARESEAVGVDGDTLVVRVHQAAWRQQLCFLKNDLLAKIESNLGKGYLKDIRFI